MPVVEISTQHYHKGDDQKLTDNSNHGVNWQYTSPGDRRKCGPLHVESSGSVGKELQKYHEDGERDYLSHRTDCQRDTLDDEVANVEAGRLGQSLGQG